MLKGGEHDEKDPTLTCEMATIDGGRSVMVLACVDEDSPTLMSLKTDAPRRVLVWSGSTRQACWNHHLHIND